MDGRRYRKGGCRTVADEGELELEVAALEVVDGEVEDELG